MNGNDIELLRRYVFERSEAAFGDLVRQHLGLVYSAALRQTGGDAHLAEDVTQEVFTDLARKAPRLTRHTSLAGWLYTSTRYAAAAVRRAEQRRCAREQEAHAMNQLLQSAGTDPAWEQLRPVLDEAMHDLKAADREALLLRFFERQPLAAVGARLGVTENAARMRVDRALDKLRGALVRRGVSSTDGALAVVLAGQAVGAVPVGLYGSVSRAALTAAGTASALSVLVARVLISAKLKLLAGTAVALAMVAPLVWHYRGSDRSATQIAQSVEPVAAVSAEQAAAATDSTSAPQTDSAAFANATTLRLTILAADANKPVAAVEVECTVKKGEQQNQEKYLSRRDGICDVHYPKDADALELVSRTDGFADTLLHWEPAKGDTIPTSYTLRLVRAVHIGGYVRDENGSPVADAVVEIRRNNAREDPAVVLSHENHEFKRMEAVADREGRWRLDRMAPEVLPRAAGFVNHPDYLFKVELFESSEAQEKLHKDAFVFKLSPAPKLRGTVVDVRGNPIPGVRIVVGEYKSGGGGPFEGVSTLADGSFVAKRVQPEATRVSFSAKGFVPKVVKLEANTDPNPLQVVLETGLTLHLRVVDPEGRPVPKGQIVADLPETNPAVLASMDAEGKATVQIGQGGGLEYRVEAPGFKSAAVAVPGSDGEERTIALSREAGVVVSGAVTDATTGQPVPAFRAVCGTLLVTGPFPTNGTFAPSRSSEDWFKFGGGKFRLELGHFLGMYAKRFGVMLKFEADGYAPSLSRVIGPDEGEVQLNVALVPARAIQVTVLNPNGRRAAGAEVGLVRPGLTLQITRERHLSVMLGSGVLAADPEGAFALPPDDSIKEVIAINSQGFAAASPAELAREPILQLQPFGRVEGRWLVGNQPAAGREVTLAMARPYAGGYVLDCSATTDSGGRFAIPQVPAGEYSVHSVPQAGGSHISRQLADVEVRPGETSTVTCGGYLVKVRVRWPKDLSPSNGTQVEVVMETPGPAVPESIRNTPEAVAQWLQSPEVQSKMQSVRRYEFSEAAGGCWTAEGVQAGASYILRALVGQDRAATNGAVPPIAGGQIPVNIPAEPTTGEIDAGEVVLRAVKLVSEGAGGVGP